MSIPTQSTTSAIQRDRSFWTVFVISVSPAREVGPGTQPANGRNPNTDSRTPRCG